MRSCGCNHTNYAFLTLLLRPHKQHLMVDSILFKKWQDCQQIAGKKNHFQKKKRIMFSLAINELKLDLNAT